MPQREFDSRKLAGLSGDQPGGRAGFGAPALAADDDGATSVGGGASLVDRALAFVAPTTLAGFAADAADSASFFPDPIVQRTSSGAASVHLHQQFRGLTIFQMAEAVRFAPDGEALDSVGATTQIPPGFDLEPKVGAAAALIAAARHLADSGGGEEERDEFGQFAPAATIAVEGFEPVVMASFPLPSRPTVFAKGPFENPIPVYLLIFGHPAGPRLAWHVVLTFPDYEDQYVVIVAADAEPGEILYSKSTLHRARARGNVFEFSPGIAPRRMVDFPRPVADYPAVLSAAAAGFPADWVSAGQALGNSTRATLNLSTTTLSASSLGDPVEFNPANQFGDDQKLLNIFYFCNYMHDFLYIIGFDEAAGNFQQVNFTHKGVANDPVAARAHSGVVRGTANMATGPDGLPPVMNMGLVSASARHTAFDADVVFHEYAHGLTNRLVGGLMQGHALDEPQSAGMGEGWSDFFALTVQNFFRAQQGQAERSVVGDWVVNDASGIRRAPYDDDYPNGYDDIRTMGDEHDVGEVWCAALMMATRRIRAALGSDEDGYRLAWTLVVDGLKLTPANPNFLEARDAILLALDHLRDGQRISTDEHKRVRRSLWESFAHFGMGAGASSSGADLASAVADASLPGDL